jgi:single-strand DNA-binding protein
MAGETSLTIVGNLTEDPAVRNTPGGDMVANFTVASTPRTYNRDTNAWEDGTTLFMRCAIWREPAQSVVDSLRKGMRVIVIGRLKQRQYEKDGANHTVIEMEVDEIGPSLKFATAQVQRMQGVQQQGQQQQSRGGFGSQQQGQQRQQQRPPQQRQQQQDDPWGSTGGYQEPPF